MAGRFSTHRVAAPALVPAVEEARPKPSRVTGLPEPAPEPLRRRRRQRHGQSAADRKAPRRQGAPASPADRGDQSFGAGKAAGRGNAQPHSGAGVAIRADRAARAQHPRAQRLRPGNPRRDDRARPARAAAQGSIGQRHSHQRPRMRLCRAARHPRADRRALQGRGASVAHHQQDRLRGRPPGR